MSDISSEDWNENEEEYLKKLHYQCIEFFKFWNQKFLYYEKKNKYFNIPILIISASNSLFAITLTNWIDQKYVSIINAVLSVMTAIIVCDGRMLYNRTRYIFPLKGLVRTLSYPRLINFK